MKKDRNCMMNNPYMQNMQMGMPMNMGYNIETSLNNIQGQINMLDKRINKLENIVMTKDNYTNYNNSNYHIM